MFLFLKREPFFLLNLDLYNKTLQFSFSCLHLWTNHIFHHYNCEGRIFLGELNDRDRQMQSNYIFFLLAFWRIIEDKAIM